MKVYSAAVLLALISWCALAACVDAQSSNPANREYGRTTLVKKTSVPTAVKQTESVREYGSQSLTKSSAASNEADYHSYVDNLERKLSTVQGPKKFLGQVVVSFVVNKTGNVQDVKVVKSSQMPQIDTAAMAAAKAAGPFGAMPKSRTKPVLVELTFDGTSSSTTAHGSVKNP
ncbi:MAG: TonB family protein [Cyanobacteria bacterium SZAS-4]|nr:TonB family protein [Cyanobacteria bacterium SZAS-4]